MCIIKRNMVCYFTLCEVKMPVKYFTDPRTRCRCKATVEIPKDDKELRQCYSHETGWQMCCPSAYHRACFEKTQSGTPRNPQRGRYEDELYDKGLVKKIEPEPLD